MVLAVACQAQFPVPHFIQPVPYAGYPVPIAQYGVPITTATQYHAQDELGQARYGYSHPGQAASNYRDAFGNQIGSYSYFNPDGKEVRVSYTADHRGFRVLSNDLPVAPQPVQDTPEVAQAKATHLAALAAATSPVVTVPVTAEAPVETKIAETPVAQPAAPVAAVAEVAPVNVLPVPVQDTAEVAAAKQEFHALYAAAKAAAAAAPDTAPVSRRKRQVPLPYAAGYSPLAYNYGVPLAYNHVSPYGYNLYNPYAFNYPVGGRFGYSFSAPFVPTPSVAAPAADATTTTQTV